MKYLRFFLYLSFVKQNCRQNLCLSLSGMLIRIVDNSGTCNKVLDIIKSLASFSCLKIPDFII
jgi:hypothetical protein